MEGKLSLIVPVYKGEKYIRENLLDMQRSISRFFPDNEIIVVVDGIADNSYLEAKSVKGVKAFYYKKNRGKGFALKYGFAKSTGDFISFCDADHDIHSLNLKNFLPYLSTADMVIGSKRHPFSRVRYPFMRRVLSWGYHMFAWAVTGVKLKDTQTGLKLIKREVLEVIMPLVMVKKYAFDLELCFLAQKHGFRVVEAPISLNFKGKISNLSPASWDAIRGMFMDTLAIRYRYTMLEYYQRQFQKARFRK